MTTSEHKRMKKLRLAITKRSTIMNGIMSTDENCDDYRIKSWAIATKVCNDSQPVPNNAVVPIFRNGQGHSSFASIPGLAVVDTKVERIVIETIEGDLRSISSLQP
jgi:hypothetical protein